MPAPAQPSNPPGVHGKEGVLAISTTAAGTVAAVALLSEYTLDMATDKVETTALGSTNKTYVQGLRDIKGSFSGFFNSTDDTLFEAADSTDGIKVELWPDIASPISFTGPAWLDVSIKGGVNSAVTVDGTFVANGEWTRTAPIALMARREEEKKARDADKRKGLA